jgi:hypothetical protein
MGDQSGDSAISLGYGPAPASPRRWWTWAALACAFAFFAGSGLFAIQRYRGPKPRDDCMPNLLTIATGLDLYAGDYGVFPPDFQTLIDEKHAEPFIFHCPRCKPTAGSLDGCYIYLPDQPVNGYPYNVLVYERQGHHPDGDYSVLVHGFVYSKLRYAQVLEMVAKTKERLKKAASQPEGGGR